MRIRRIVRLKPHHLYTRKFNRKWARLVLTVCVNTLKSVRRNQDLTYLPALPISRPDSSFKSSRKRALGVATYLLSPGNFPRREGLTKGGAILPHDALHRSDDLLHNRWWRRCGVHCAMRMCPQIVDQLLRSSQKQVTRGSTRVHWRCHCLPPRWQKPPPFNSTGIGTSIWDTRSTNTVTAHCQQQLGQTHGNILRFCFVLCFWLCCAACGILVPRPGIEPAPSAVKARSPDHWTTREFSFVF